MREESNIDKLFREGLSVAQPHAFNEAAWDNMSAMLDQKQSFSWQRVGKLASAAMFLSTLFIASNQLPVETETSLIVQNQTESAINAIIEGASIENRAQTENAQASLTSSAKEQAATDRNGSDLLAESFTPKPASQISVSVKEESTENTEDVESFKSETASSEIAFTSNAINKLEPAPADLGGVLGTTTDRLALNDDYAGFDPVDPESLPKNKRQSIGFYGGFTLENGLASTTDMGIHNLLYVGGLTYSFELSENISLNTRIGYRSKSGKGIELSRTQTTYGFGKSTSTQTLALNRLHYAEMPLEVNYNLKGKHNILVGASTSYLVAVNSQLEETKTESLKESQSTTTSSWDYQEGLQNIDLNLRVGYDYNLSNNLKIGGQVQYGLTDITSNQVYEVQDNSNNMEVRVTLKYNPFKF